MRITVSKPEFNTIMAALRWWQNSQMTKPGRRGPLFEEIATNSGTDVPLDDKQIDDLCTRINTTVSTDPRDTALAALGLLTFGTPAEIEASGYTEAQLKERATAALDMQNLTVAN
ncbi:MAG: hypothetical protein GC184_06195 [Rhizobiales bacterium]|nr:hypothetical protein [Hyphomicrobiales bacterium]